MKQLIAQLTAREQEVLALIADGLSNRQISHVLHISVYTVQNHVQNLITKLGVRNRTQAASVYSRSLRRETGFYSVGQEF
jgi:DNA-binding NarL/FixJ family response regulator